MIAKKFLSAASALATVIALSFSTSASADERKLGLYVRGDIGVMFSENLNSSLGGGEFNTVEMTESNTIFPRIGLGAEIIENVRIDLTFSRRSDIANGKSTLTSDGDFASSFGLDIDSNVVMAQIYGAPLGFLGIDTGPFEPFISAGIGYARNSTSELVAVTPTGTQSTVEGSSSEHLAWSLGGGVSVDLGNSWNVDLSYEYLNLGETASGTRAVTADGTVFTLRDNASFSLSSHDILLGLRYNF